MGGGGPKINQIPLKIEMPIPPLPKPKTQL